MVIKLKTINERAPGNGVNDAGSTMINRGVIKARTLEAGRVCGVMLPMTDHDWYSLHAHFVRRSSVML